MMKIRTMMAAMVALVLCVGVAAQAAKTPKPKPIKGLITKIDGTSVTVQPTAKKGADAPEPVVVTTTDSTTVTINGEKKAVSDLAAGQKAAVTVDTDGKAALSIAITEKVAKK